MITPTLKCLQFHVAAILIDHLRNSVLRAKHDGRTGGEIVVADQIYRGRFLFASKNCENNKNTDFATLFLVLQKRKSKRKLADVNFNKCRNREISSKEFFAETWPKMTFLRFLAKCVFLMANNLEQESSKFYKHKFCHVRGCFNEISLV
jgi:hypothetical protein